MTEAEIVQGCRKGDPRAIRALAENYYDRVFRVAHTLASNPHGAEDLTQETFTAAIKSIVSFRSESGLFTWLVAVLRRQWLYRRRRDSRLKIVGELDAGAAPQEDLDRRDAREELRAAFRRMDGEDRAILELFHIEEMRYHEIAAALEIPIGTVKSRLHGARQKLRGLIEGSHAL
jgi:RNA polymerase sigma-70 factor (ECF subfamily)